MFSINTGVFGSGNMFNGLAAGSYTIHVKDANGCEKSAIVTITQPDLLVILCTQKVNVLCNGESSGSITANASGGTAPYQFSINAGAFSANNVFSGLAAGSYTIHVKDANGCEKTTVVIITQPTLVVLSTQKTDVLCIGENNGSITASATGGTAPYMFSINAGAFSSNNVFSGLAAGSYTIHVKDANGCEKTTVVTITQPTLLVCNTQKTDVLCNGGNTGSITGSATGGVAPYQFSINAGAFSSNNVFTGLTAGTYTTQVKDANGCEKTCIVTINQPVLLVLCIVKTEVICICGSHTATITASATGGTAPYQFSINDGAFSANNIFGSLGAGTYTIHVRDANGCEKMTVVTISDPPATTFRTAASCLITTPDQLPIGRSKENVLTASVSNAAKYIWSSDNDEWVITSGQGTSSITYSAGTENATFKLKVVNATGCKDSCTVNLRTSESTPINSIEKMVMKAYPNPFANSTTIEFMAKIDGNVTVNVYTLSGARVVELFNGNVKADESRQVIFNGANLTNGIYIYKITIDNKVYFDKLILQK
jgi:hypothetical protein